MLYSFSCQFRFLLVRASQRAEKCKSTNHWHGMTAQWLRAPVSHTGHRLLLTPTSGLTTTPYFHAKRVQCPLLISAGTRQTRNAYMNMQANQSQNELLAWLSSVTHALTGCGYIPDISLSIDTELSVALNSFHYLLTCPFISITK